EAESRDLGSFETIELRGAAELNILVGEPSAIKIDGTEYAVKNLTTEVHDSTLTIEARKSGWAWFGDRDELKLSVSTPKLTVLQSSGAGNIRVTGMKGGEQSVRIAGAHNIEAHGQLDKLTIELSGAGNVDYGD